MGILTSKVGKVKIGADELKCKSASLSITIDPGDISYIGTTWKRNLSLAKSWSLSLTFDYDSTDTAQVALRDELITGDGDIPSVSMYEDDTVYFDGAAQLGSWSHPKAAGALDIISVTLNGNGPLSYSG